VAEGIGGVARDGAAADGHHVQDLPADPVGHPVAAGGEFAEDRGEGDEEA